MNVAATLDSYRNKVDQLHAEIADLRRRLDEAERAWAEALNRERDAQEELSWLRKELEDEAQ